ncbi:MAG: hypothetical protein UX10_C0009G0025 [Candidatus Magasanikbacteria bacterium GW2011_GWA2_45_39]|uniref:Uncharacterized protein n=2 Tax=Candidatus Magasanikiibacteriota TaxID=1752731 RepID=A0A0G1N142_9BACT|nr:MAG: hypothetical protein UX10_C0009G0025 [Candidatus Magasanikbacteria bacterium GW2011_GWA2_45_39]KKU14199.1 MAG: hypothetical protein UX20_C0004G0026 [Candidatus Magasanikbacteria bacterium GW2011_GWC2_45_8]HBW73779.1 hypothetical protein [Candidatus Magasanikbacteria bacterium]
MKTSYSIYLAGEWIETVQKLAVINPYNAQEFAYTFLASDRPAVIECPIDYSENTHVFNEELDNLVCEV